MLLQQPSTEVKQRLYAMDLPLCGRTVIACGESKQQSAAMCFGQVTTWSPDAKLAAHNLAAAYVTVV